VMGDQVYYELPYGWLGTMAHKLFVKRDLKHIFRHRARVLRDRFGGLDG
jgi:ligand-binding SRPBCC domain-containing protein